jgi:coenzyme PQQ precursor peptide PqqA
MRLCRLHGYPSKLPVYPTNRRLKDLCKLQQIAFEFQNTRQTAAVKQESVMKVKVWARPEVKEVHLGCEINSYAPAEI